MQNSCRAKILFLEEEDHHDYDEVETKHLIYEEIALIGDEDYILGEA